MAELCRECGAHMTEEFRTSQGGVVYVWLECSRKACGGKFLQGEALAETREMIGSRAVPPTAWLSEHNEPPTLQGP